MNKAVAESRSKFESAFNELNERSRRYKTILQNIEQTQERINALHAQIEEAEIQKTDSVKRFSYGLAPDDEVKAATDKLEGLQIELADLKARLVSMKAARMDLGATLSGYEGGQQTLDVQLREYGRVIAESLLHDVLDRKTLNAIHKAFAAWNQEGGHFGDFLNQTLRSAEPDDQVYERCRAEIFKRYIEPVTGDDPNDLLIDFYG